METTSVVSPPPSIGRRQSFLSSARAIANSARVSDVSTSSLSSSLPSSSSLSSSFSPSLSSSSTPTSSTSSLSPTSASSTPIPMTTTSLLLPSVASASQSTSALSSPSSPPHPPLLPSSLPTSLLLSPQKEKEFGSSSGSTTSFSNTSSSSVSNTSSSSPFGSPSYPYPSLPPLSPAFVSLSSLITSSSSAASSPSSSLGSSSSFLGGPFPPTSPWTSIQGGREGREGEIGGFGTRSGNMLPRMHSLDSSSTLNSLTSSSSSSPSSISSSSFTSATSSCSLSSLPSLHGLPSPSSPSSSPTYSPWLSSRPKASPRGTISEMSLVLGSTSSGATRRCKRGDQDSIVEPGELERLLQFRGVDSRKRNGNGQGSSPPPFALELTLVGETNSSIGRASIAQAMEIHYPWIVDTGRCLFVSQMIRWEQSRNGIEIKSTRTRNNQLKSWQIAPIPDFTLAIFHAHQPLEEVWCLENHTNVVIFVFDLTFDTTLYALLGDPLKRVVATAPNVPRILVGNKTDIVGPNKPIPKDEVEAIAGVLAVDMYLETSAYTMAGISDLVRAVLEIVTVDLMGAEKVEDTRILRKGPKRKK